MDIDWDLLTRYLAGACTDEERDRFEQWLAESPEHRAVLQGARDMVAHARREVPAGREAELLASLRREMAAAAEGAPRPPVLRVVRDDSTRDEGVRGDTRRTVTFPLSARRSRWTTRLKVAAAVLLVAGGAAAWEILGWGTPAGQTASAPAFREVATTLGQRIAFQLPDGSAVTLAPGSRMRIPADYGVRDRTVSLTGEAAFTVTHDEDRPFAVHTTQAIAKDLGTRFIVRAYDDDPTTDVIVSEGEVELRGRTDTAAAHEPKVLRRGQLGRVEPSGEIAVRSGVDLERYFAWTEGRLVFRDTPLHEAAAQLGRWYDIDVRLASDAIAERRLTASAQDEPADDVLRMVAASLDLELTTVGRVYTLRAR